MMSYETEHRSKTELFLEILLITEGYELQKQFSFTTSEIILQAANEQNKIQLSLAVTCIVAHQQH